MMTGDTKDIGEDEDNSAGEGEEPLIMGWDGRRRLGGYGDWVAMFGGNRLGHMTVLGPRWHDRDGVMDI
ncbi:hypothetical protein OsI_10196 [Oryza sativa Indica Group]|uniref:Uncharacterized protein n=4 Tax=Oryza TaxID=4527 RepID=A0A8J8Y5X5_ORYSJ|nr:hypothetical protein LOC_Os03g07490 [Oryza sativa Japonica Group]EAY88721.1 hypothetical protein OsI_10196 [Oryza sativa Indica Group]EAZ25747.1 hypothetical protein OsJ_09585 [Oryza sativa Japonica Group]KAF2937528.1 hypothetical protein DAI22_03g056100 [Oryza sativa Japonica Group]